jgi:hypothetical protein
MHAKLMNHSAATKALTFSIPLCVRLRDRMMQEEMRHALAIEDIRNYSGSGSIHFDAARNN